ncbi:hypothetical protein BD309DRAFT_860636 [Dichomitus squalens]|nr:hypothetical protein BD309DRAFT_860636 [Dichomitus squalens]
MTQCSFSACVYLHANALPPAVWRSFRENPHTSNIMLAHAEKATQRPSAVPGLPNAHGDLWVVLWDIRYATSSPSVSFVLSCTTGPLGTYPIFIFTPLSATHLSYSSISPRILAVVDALRGHVPPERVFSVFATDNIADVFADTWTARTGISLDQNPVYYHARLMYCDKSTFQSRQLSNIPGAEAKLRRAVGADVAKVGRLCHAFAADSEPFVLSRDKAIQEAKLLIQNNQVWVYEIRMPGGEPEIASIVAATRATETVTAITKVLTDPTWRSRGCAERLTRHVCQHLLETKAAVVLYVAHGKYAAESVYRRVGFVGFSEYSKSAMGESWKELGFDRSRVELGHW